MEEHDIHAKDKHAIIIISVNRSCFIVTRI